MRSNLWTAGSAVLLSTTAIVVGAQSAAPQAPASAAANASAPASYGSAFDGFRRFADQPVGPWREANDTVGRVGGWRAYAREAAGPGASAGQGGMQMQAVERAAAVQPAASSPGPAAAPAKGHAGHGSK